MVSLSILPYGFEAKHQGFGIQGGFPAGFCGRNEKKAR
jgi:hypothetical protein